MTLAIITSVYLLSGVMALTVARLRFGPCQEITPMIVAIVIAVNPLVWIALAIGAMKDFLVWLRGAE